MRSFVALVLDWLHQVTLALWLGGILVLGIAGAPAVFGAARQAGHTTSGMPLYDFAGTALAAAFGRLNGLILVCGGVMLAAGTAAGLLAGGDRRVLAARAALTGIAWGAASWLGVTLYPRMLAARAAGEGELFAGMHRAYSAGFQAQALLLLAVCGLTAWISLRRGALLAAEHAPRPARRPAHAP